MPTAALYIELDWVDIRHTRRLEMLRLKNRIIKMDEYRWPKIVLDWSLSQNVESWSHELKLVLAESGLPDHDHLYGQTNLDSVEQKLMSISRNKWHMESLTKS